MNMIIVLAALMAFGYIACNLGSSNKPGHQSYGCAPALWVLVACLVALIAWPAIGPVVTALLHMFGAHV